jgi:hypothetical protein
MEVRAERANRVDALRIIGDKAIVYYYYEGDIVRISRTGSRDSYIEGRISWIETLELQLDTSEKYNQKYRKIKLDDIATIELVERRENV